MIIAHNDNFKKNIFYAIMYNTEAWLSGLRHLTANEAGFYDPRGFKSHRFRIEL